MKKNSRNIILSIIIILIVAGALSNYNLPGADKPAEVGVSVLVQNIKDGKVAAIEVEQSKLNITLADGTEQISHKEGNESLSTLLSNYELGDAMSGIEVTITELAGWKLWAQNLLPILVPFLFIGGFIWLMMRQASGMNNRAMSFGQSKSEDNQKQKRVKTTFADIAGVKEAKEELGEIVEFLKYPKKFLNIGARIPRGVLLLGPPGTGKTLLAKAIAGEANVPFYNISGSEFVEMFVGVGASRVRDLFAKAKKNSPAIIFIDEIDAVGRQRGAGLGGSHDEREQTLNQILVEMDGFETDVSVIIIAATNRPDVLDPALLRPGRFDRQVVIDAPDLNDREAILKVHAKTKPLAKDVMLRTIAERTPGFAGADLANLLNEAAILAARKNKKEISMANCLESIEKVMLGPERKSHVLSPEEKKVTAFHEAGHAVVAHFLPNADPVHKISIISRGRAAGYTLKLPDHDRHLQRKSAFLDDIAVSLGGHAIEKIIFGEVTTGASSDLKTATRLARKLVTQYGMSEKMGPRTFGEKEEMVFLGREIHEQRDYSEAVAAKIDQEVSTIISAAYKVAQGIIRKQKKRIHAVVAVLMKKETIERKDFEALMA